MFDWPRLLHLGLHHLRLRPEQFWDLTPYELVTMAGLSPGQGQHATRESLNALVAQFPDTSDPGKETE